jgi:hypothetical protein
MHIQDICEDKARNGDGLFAIAYALLEIADAQNSMSVHLKNLGNADASTPFGAIEGLAMHIGEKLDAFATTLAAAIETGKE